MLTEDEVRLLEEIVERKGWCFAPNETLRQEKKDFICEGFDSEWFNSGIKCPLLERGCELKKGPQHVTNFNSINTELAKEILQAHEKLKAIENL